MERKRICFTSPGVAELVDENVAEIAEDEALIKTEYSAISAGTEFANLVGEPNIPSGDKWPKGCGYSSVGRIIAVGERFTKFKVGDRVIVYHGYHTNYNKAKANKIFRVPDGLDSKEAALVIIAAMGLGAVRKLNIELGHSAMIIGLGLLGVFAMQFARASGACPLIVSDFNEERRQLALKLGADYALDPAAPDYIEQVKKITGGKGVKSIVEVTGSSRALEQALELVAPMGSIALNGCTRVSDMHIDYYSQVHKPGVRLIGAHNFVRPKVESYPGHWTMEDDCLSIMELALAGRIDIRSIISEVHSPSEATDVFERLANDHYNFPLGVLFDWNE
ncbi:MAG: zinc-binding alcohol dehydrogenase [Clostridia bacterium]|nr:zinc-binding alcohol dehydrogenase [Clostridia bacterium]MBQ5808578.1 zinc-binding alcohol dehydrogenase [Clostridia bacterium]